MRISLLENAKKYKEAKKLIVLSHPPAMDKTAFTLVQVGSVPPPPQFSLSIFLKSDFHI